MSAWLYFGFTVFLTGTLIGIILYYFQEKRKGKIESPKYRMLDDD